MLREEIFGDDETEQSEEGDETEHPKEEIFVGDETEHSEEEIFAE